MNKRAFIKYSSKYGGQSFKLKNKRKAFIAVMDFLAVSAVFDKPEKAEMKIFETPDRELDIILIADFEKLFGKGTRTLYAQHYEGGNEQYCWNWNISFDDVNKCLDWFEKQKKFPNYFMQPTLTISFVFKWKDTKTGNQLPYQKAKYTDCEYSYLLLFLSKTNTVILDLNFPFESVNECFATLRESILRQLPIELKDKGFRLWIPCKDNETYKQRKI